MRVWKEPHKQQADKLRCRMPQGAWGCVCVCGWGGQPGAKGDALPGPGPPSPDQVSVARTATDVRTQRVPSITHTATQFPLHLHDVTHLYTCSHGSHENTCPLHTHTCAAGFSGSLELWAITTGPSPRYSLGPSSRDLPGRSYRLALLQPGC